ncbi:MAG: cobalamin-binding protein [Candidatus Lambdaproteobacteria bacterium RIFOXYD1_FULL_56_27]|uniref:Cobalamin-binding protein n=1 Tax=Candidatus Lambdaproteobacteria bacterium RIFOXYD2_FULL_56_26 TaxID=1817773 RepID=A0A1F6H3L9_9PROT|nr:MAG: cobalamin-binding protein [Candidatus Lambdaproteobacteria bacterium RIFOXYC1_FULL_56_13]OGH04979.1 MAG: cobalamin-binding protein [Candidatus Lambdaproteobacteria bacterium RIFOXYD2_FULL_56_26]OGH09444.1 MAG: cobalamin-binding protein [Candidatus Lambdaproteobacteria bacterium RIFOXYD1_FULL_56_27]
MATNGSPEIVGVTEAFYQAVFDTDRNRAFAVVQQALDQGISAEELVFSAVIPSMDRMIKAVSEDFNASLAQHFMTAQIASQVTDLLLSKFSQKPAVLGRVVIGTAFGDLHTLGKRIVIGCLKSLMVEVTDLGVNVSPEKFVDEAQARGAGVIAISAMMVHTARGEQGALAVRELLAQRGVEDRIKLVVGGAPFRFDPELYKVVRADAWADDGISAGRVITRFLQGEVL